MINLSSLKLSDLLPSSIKDDETISALTKALESEFQSISACINEIVMLPRIDELSEELVDSLAWQFHVDYYEPLGLSLEKKRALVKSSLSWHRRKGTKSVLEEIIRILFLDNFRIEEWFEYGGEPYYFRLVIEDSIDSREKYNDIVRAIYELKNVRSWLEGIRLSHKNDCNVFFGEVIRHKRKFVVTCDMKELLSLGTFYTGTLFRHKHKFVVPSYMEVV